MLIKMQLSSIFISKIEVQQSSFVLSLNNTILKNNNFKNSVRTDNSFNQPVLM